jgi:hypothetical protein
MWLAIFCLVTFSVTKTSAAGHDEDTEQYWTRLNYGLVATKEAKVCVVDGYWSYAIHLELPELPTLTDTIPTATCERLCGRVKVLANATQQLVRAMKTSIKETVSRIFDLIPDINAPPPRSRTRPGRGLLDIVGSPSRYLFGTATEGDVEGMKKMINDVEAMAGTATADAARTREGLASFTKVQNERMDNFRKILTEEHKTIEMVFREIRAGSDTEQIEFSAVAYATNALARYVKVHDGLQQLLLGIEDLVHGQLTPRLIDVDLLQEARANITGTLRRKGKDLCLASTNEMYTNGNYDFARRGRDLFIQLRLPFTNVPKMSIYRLHVLPVPVPGEQQLTMQLKEMPLYVVMSVSDHRIGTLTRVPDIPVVEASEIEWHTGRQSCLTAIKIGDPQMVSKLCDFTVQKKELSPTYLKLAERKYVVSNLTSVRSYCGGDTRTPLSSEQCVPCLITLGCSCSLVANEIVIRAENPDCDNYTSQVQVSHALNLAVLQTFYEMSNASLNGAQLVNVSLLKTVQPINLPFFSDQTDKLLAADEAASYSLKKLTESLQNDSVILHTPAEAVVHDLLRQNSLMRSFEITSWTTWITLLPWVAVAILMALHVSTFLKMRSLSAAVAMMGLSRLPKINAFAVRTEPPTTAETPAWQLAILEIRHYDLIFIFGLVLLTIAVIILIVAIKRALSRRSFIYLDLASSKGIAQIKFCTLPDPSRNFSVALPKKPTTLTCVSCGLFGVVKFTSKPWKLIRAHDGHKIQLPTYMILPFWKFCAVKTVLGCQDCKITPLLVHSHEYVYPDAMKQASVPNTDNPPDYRDTRF